MGLFDNLKAMKDAAVAGYRGDGPSDEALAALTPEQRAAYEAQLAQTQQAAAEVAEASARRLAARPLQGPAGEWLYGPSAPAASAEDVAAMSTAAALELERQRQQEMWGELFRNPFGRKRPPAPEVDPQVDPQAQAAAELAARTAARAPYVATERVPLRITRIPASGDGVEEVASFLASSGLSARPDLVFGSFRVPDHHPGAAVQRRGRGYVEWAVVHADVTGLASGPAPHVATFDAEERWVERAVGEPSVLDEDLAVAYLASLGLGPESCLGVARRMAVRNVGGDDTSGGATMAWVTGVHVLHAPGPPHDGEARFRAARPADIPHAGLPGVHVEVLNWQAVAQVVRPQTHRPPPIPSPFPYLPGTADELLVAYLEVVGVHPAHCYGAAVVESGPRSIEGRGGAGPVSTSTNLGSKVRCADGEHRRRLHAGRHVVVAHLDAPAYQEGRARWAAYQRDVLQATLEHETGARRPVEPPRLGSMPAGVRGLVRAAEGIGTLIDGEHDPFADHPRHRYCWPPTG